MSSSGTSRKQRREQTSLIHPRNAYVCLNPQHAWPAVLSRQGREMVYVKPFDQLSPASFVLSTSVPSAPPAAGSQLPHPMPTQPQNGHRRALASELPHVLVYLPDDSVCGSIGALSAWRSYSITFYRRALSLYEADRTLTIALDVARAFCPATEYMMRLWPGPGLYKSILYIRRS